MEKIRALNSAIASRRTKKYNLKFIHLPRKIRQYNDPKFNEWMVELLANLQPNQKGLLNEVELSHLQDRKTIQLFVDHASQDRLDILLTKVGIHCVRAYYNPGKLNPEIIRQSHNQFNIKGKSLEVIKDMLAQDFFVISSRDIALALTLMSMNCHSEAFQPAPQAAAFKGAAAAAIDKGQREAQEGMAQVAKVMFASFGLDSFLEAMYNLSRADAMILLLLYIHAGRWVGISYLQRMMGQVAKKSLIGVRAGKLFREHGYLDKLTASGKQPRFTITSKGTLVIGEIIRRTLNNEFK